MFAERSIDIILSEQPPEPRSAEAVIVPLSSTESLVATRGLRRQIEEIYRFARKNSDSEKALLKVHAFITEDIEEYRRRAFNLSVALSSEKILTETKALAALGITHFIVGQKNHRSGVWVRGRAREEQLLERFYEVMASDELTFLEQSDWAKTQTSRNDRFWRQELQAVRAHPVIAELREAIETSDHAPKV